MTKVITPEKIVLHKCCLPSSNISVRDFDTDVLGGFWFVWFFLTIVVSLFKVVSVIFCCLY